MRTLPLAALPAALLLTAYFYTPLTITNLNTVAVYLPYT